MTTGGGRTNATAAIAIAADGTGGGAGPRAEGAPADANATLTTFRDCWLLFGRVDDLGWTHMHNVARRDIHAYLRRRYPRVEFQSLATPGTFFLSEEDRHALLVDHYIGARGCDYVFASSDGILNGRDAEYAREFPGVSFGRMLDPPGEGPGFPPNLVDFWTDWFPSSFVAGAVAASLSEGDDGADVGRCAGFVNAFETAGGAWAHATGFAMGYHWRWREKNPDGGDPPEVHVATMNSYYRPDAEVMAARQIVEKFGCGVISKHTDPNNVDQYVYSLSQNQDGDGKAVVSISRYIDMSLFVGDSAITSQVTDFVPAILPSVESSLLSKLRNLGRNVPPAVPGAMYEYDPARTPDELILDDPGAGGGAPLRSLHYGLDLSPFTGFVGDEGRAEDVAERARRHLAVRNPLCGLRWRGGDRDFIIGKADAGDCSPSSRLPHPIVSYADLGPRVIYYEIPFEDGGDVCGAGTFYSYDADLTLACTPCPANTYYPGLDAGGRAGPACLPCPPGTVGASRRADGRGSVRCRPPEEKNQLGPGVRAYGFALAGLVGVASAGCALFVARYRRKRVILAAQPVFLYLLCGGTSLMGASIVPLAVDDSLAAERGCDVACVAFPWLLALGFSSVFAALFSKIWRMNKVFKAALAMSRARVTTKDVMIPFVVLISLNVLLLLLWTLIDPPEYNRYYTNDYESESIGTCWRNWSMASASICILLVVLNLSAVVLANIQAYQARSMSSNLSETKYIWLIMVGLLQILAICLPLVFLVVENPIAFFFLLSTIISFTSASILLLIFVPKMRAVSLYGDDFSIQDHVLTSIQRHRASIISTRRAGISSARSIVQTDDTREGRAGEQAIAAATEIELLGCKRKLKKATELLSQKGIVFDADKMDSVFDDEEKVDNEPA